jgi:TRAP-type C4-dicarboxylate transport system permease small subunit
MPTVPAPRRPITRAVLRLSGAVIQVERLVLMGLLAWLLLLILLNVVTRYAGVPLYWVDEAAVYSVVWLTFVGASAMTRLRMDFAVTLLTDKLGPRSARRVRCAATASVLGFGLALVAMCWLWMDPVGIARHGFDAREYAAQSFNFLYTERTQTLNWPTWVVQLILPIFALTFSLHALANLLEDLGRLPRETIPGFPQGQADAVN